MIVISGLFFSGDSNTRLAVKIDERTLENLKDGFEAGGKFVVELIDDKEVFASAVEKKTGKAPRLVPDALLKYLTPDDVAENLNRWKTSQKGSQMRGTAKKAKASKAKTAASDSEMPF